MGKELGRMDISEPLRIYTACEERCQEKLQTILERLERIEKVLEELRKGMIRMSLREFLEKKGVDIKLDEDLVKIIGIVKIDLPREREKEILRKLVLKRLKEKYGLKEAGRNEG